MHSNYHLKLYSDSATGGPVERIPGVVDQLERIDIFYMNKDSGALKQWTHALDTPVLQYIISKKGKRIKDAFETLGITWNLYSPGNSPSIHFIFNKDSKQDEIVQILKEGFEKEIVRDVESMAVKMSANMIERVKGKLSNLCLEKDKHKAVYFDTKKGYLTCVADNDSYLNELLMDIGYEDVEKIKLNDISAQVLQDLQFEQAVKTSHPRLKCITFDNKNGSFTLKWQGKKETSGSELLSKFKGKIRECVVLVNAQNAKHIVFNTITDGRVNDTFVEYIKEMTKQSLNTSAIPLFTFDFSLKRISLYTLDNVKAIQEIVNQSIIERQLDTETAKHFFKGGSSLDFCKKATDERKLLYDTNINRIVCIKSVQKDLDDLINQAIPYKEEPLDLSELQVSFLKQYGSQLMEQVEKRYDIAVKLENNRCLFRGKESQLLQKGKEFMVNSLKKLLTHMSIETNEVAVLKLKEGIENVVAENNCKWNLNFTNEFCNTDLNKYLGAWHDPLAHIITCVQNVDNGDMVAADLVIEVITSNLFPLSKHFTKENPLVGRNMSGERFSVMHEQILEGPFKTDAFCCKSMFAFVICSSYSSGMQYQFISFQQLKNCYSRALQYADKNGMKSLALSTKLINSSPLENDITRAILAASFEFVEANHQHGLRKFTLCCDKENCHNVCGTVENFYEKRKGYQRILSLALEPNKQNAVISLNVKVGSITDSKRDVIVNTVNIRLDFAKDQVSKKILEKAGPEMQRECIQKYPNGISYDQIAYTCSYNISYTGNVKYLFHGALPDFCFQGYEKTVKCFVKRCLYLADRLDCKTLVFPTIGVGKLGYPRRETAAAMFEAIEEYPKEAANCGIQEVDIMVFDRDQNSYMNFRDEKWRKSKVGATHRPNLAEKNEVDAVPYQMLVRNIGKETKVRVAKVGACRIPPFALEIVMRVGSMEIKSASKPPLSWNDQIDVCLKCSDIQNIDFEKLGKVLFEERITEVFFIANNKDGLPFSEQVIQIANVIKQLSEISNGLVYLKTCTVFVDDHVEETVMTKDKRWSWTEFVDESGLSIELLCQTEECLEKARGSITQLLMKSNNEEHGQPRSGSATDDNFLKGDSPQTEPLISSSRTCLSGSGATIKATESTLKTENNTEGDTPCTGAPKEEEIVFLSQGTFFSGNPGNSKNMIPRAFVNTVHDKHENCASASGQTGTQYNNVQTRGQGIAGNAHKGSPSVGPAGPSGDAYDDPAEQLNIGQDTRTNADVRERLEEEPFHDKQERLCSASAPIKQTGYAGKGKSQNQGKVSLTKGTECSLNVDYELNDGCSDNKHLKDETKKGTYNAPEMQTDFLFRKTANTEADFQNNPSSNAISLHGASKHQDIEISQDSYSGLQIKSKCSYCDTQKHSSECSKTNGTYTFSKEGGHWCILDAKSDELLTVLDSEAGDIYFKGKKLVVVDGTFHKITEDNGVVELHIVHRQSSASKTYHNQLHSSTKGCRSKSAEQFQADIENSVASKQEVLPPSPQVRKKNWTRAWNKDQTLENPLETESTQIVLTPSGGREFPRVYGEDDDTR